MASIAVLEEQVSHAEAMLRLGAHDVEKASRMIDRTEAELAIWKGGPPAGPGRRDWLPQHIVLQVTALRDLDEDRKADAVIKQLCRSEPVEIVRPVWWRFRSEQRPLDRECVVVAAAKKCAGLDRFHSISPHQGFCSRAGLDWSTDLVAALATSGPAHTIRLFGKATRERDRTS
ncbi:hypothetical protein OG948_00435 [Embleya sp. NBC_00888]|uniref:hypothetical protein n=1 Tax=Embleya sp. NBC_00888 TaxID=2975960 RepID=UPI00386956D9|nr:hypothetical protein OG948_00435 [Embleya sp. NBC_00888]